VSLLETLIGGWRPLQRLDSDGFAILRSRGITRRANSILALDPPADAAELEAVVDRVESLVAMTGEDPVHRILEGHAPGLEELLTARGREPVGRSEIWELPLSGARLPRPDDTAVIATGALDEDWFEAAFRLALREGEQARETLHDILAGTPAIQVRLMAEDVAVATGRAALVEFGRRSTAVLNMIAVDPEHRRRGLGRALSTTLLALAQVQGASRALLEVEAENTPARALYRDLGFRRIADYHYRVPVAAPASR
jgi:ribosomal protein S18 acetylase RimI-like enzyme